jgi:hypothetical protein
VGPATFPQTARNSIFAAWGLLWHCNENVLLVDIGSGQSRQRKFYSEACASFTFVPHKNGARFDDSSDIFADMTSSLRPCQRTFYREACAPLARHLDWELCFRSQEWARGRASPMTPLIQNFARWLERRDSRCSTRPCGSSASSSGSFSLWRLGARFEAPTTAHRALLFGERLPSYISTLGQDMRHDGCCSGLSGTPQHEDTGPLARRGALAGTRP